jgi:hypothetical protein
VDLAQIVRVISDAGIIGLLVVILVGGSKRWWAWGWQYEDLIKEKDEWKRLALSGTDMAEKLTSIAQSIKEK